MGSQATLELFIELKGDAAKGMKEVAGAAQETAKSGGMLQNAFSFAMGGALTAGLGAGLGVVKDFFSGAMEEANEAAGNMAQLDAVLTSTGGKAGWTKEQALALADALSAGSGLSMATDDAILAGQNLMLTFTNIGADVFPGAMQAAIDMAQAMGQDVSSASMMLGKALNDPVAGLGKLSKAGVQFTKEQQDMIKAMVAAGDTAGAQAIMIAELGVQFGGSASAAAQTFEGRMMMLQESFNNVKQSVGEALMPILMRLMTFLASPDVMGAIQAISEGLVAGIGGGVEFLLPLIIQTIDWIKQAVTWFSSMAEGATSVSEVLFNMAESADGFLSPLLGLLSGIVASWEQFFTTVSSGGDIWLAAGELIGNFADVFAGAVSRIGPMLVEAWPQIQAFFMQILQAIGDALPGILATLGQWALAFVEWVAPMIPPLLGALAGFAGALLGWLAEQVGPLLALLGEWAVAFWTWIEPMIGPALAKLGEFVGKVLAWLGVQIPPLMQKLGEWAKAFWEWISPMIGPALAKLGEFAVVVLGWLASQVGPLLQKLGEWAKAFWEWISPMIPPFLEELGKLAIDLLGWLADQVPPIVAQLLEWAKAFLDWILPLIPPALEKLGELALDLLEWLADQVPILVEKLGEWAGAFLGWIAEAASGLPPKLMSFIQSVGEWIANEGLPLMSDAVGDLANGFLNFVGQAAGKLGDALGGFLAELAKAVPGFAEKVKDAVISVGTYLVGGIRAGVEGAWDNFMKFLQDLINQIPQPIRDALGIHSDSQVMIDIFKFLPTGMAAGIRQTFPVVTAAIDEIIQHVYEKLAGAITAQQVAELLTGTPLGLHSPGGSGGPGGGGGPPMIAAAAGYEGWVDKPTHFLVSEDTPEYVSITPKSRMRGAAAGTGSRGGGGAGQGVTLIIERVEINALGGQDGTQLATQFLEAISQQVGDRLRLLNITGVEQYG